MIITVKRHSSRKCSLSLRGESHSAASAYFREENFANVNFRPSEVPLSRFGRPEESADRPPVSAFPPSSFFGSANSFLRYFEAAWSSRCARTCRRTWLSYASGCLPAERPVFSCSRTCETSAVRHS